MKSAIEPSSELLLLAEAQSGILTRQQVLGHGLTRPSLYRILRQGRWTTVARGVYSTVGGELSWEARAWAGTLMGGQWSRVGGLAAAKLHGLLATAPAEILIMTPHDRRHLDREPWRFVRERAGVRDKESRGDPPRVSIADTVLDLCDPRIEDSGESVTHWVTNAVQKRLVTTKALRRALAGRSRHPNRRLILELIGEVADGSESVLELRYRRDVERAHGLPTGTRQQVRRAARNERGASAFRDVVYEDYGLVVELDGRPGHTEEGRIDDLRRDNVTTLRGERTLRYGWADVVDETCVTARQVAVALTQGGWPGILTPCPHCALSVLAGEDWFGDGSYG